MLCICIVYLHPYLCTHTCKYTCMYIYIYINICIYMYMNTCICIYTYVYVDEDIDHLSQDPRLKAFSSHSRDILDKDPILIATRKTIFRQSALRVSQHTRTLQGVPTHTHTHTRIPCGRTHPICMTIFRQSDKICEKIKNVERECRSSSPLLSQGVQR